MKNKYYCIKEFGYLASDNYVSKVDKGNVILDKESFNNLETLVLENSHDNGLNNFLTISYKKGVGKILKAQNYVGIIALSNGTIIEILPKIYTEAEEDKTRKMFIKMLKTLKDAPFKNFNMANLKVEKMSIFDIFITMFIKEVERLIKIGLKSNYISVEENYNSFKGKLLVSEHIKNNLVHREKFYVKYDKFLRNRPENRLIKTTLVYLIGKTNNSLIQGSIRKCLFNFQDIDYCKSISKDISQCSKGRDMKEYKHILNWCRIFLKGKSFGNYKGKEKSYCLLFPMEKIFESYVAKSIAKSEYFKDYKIKTQFSNKYLIEKPKMFKLIPDIVLEKNDNIIILDTKWKIIFNEQYKNYGIAQSDLYQMYAYGKKYKSKKIFLIYPTTKDNITNIKYNFEEDMNIYVFFIKLENVEQSLKALRDILN